MLPEYIAENLQEYQTGISNCVEKNYVFGDNPYEPSLGLTGTKADGLCKTKKLKNIETTLSSIKDRVQAWLR